MSEDILDGFFLPPALEDAAEFIEMDLGSGVKLRQAVAAPELIATAAAHLRKHARNTLRRMPLDGVIGLLDAAAEEWLAARAPDHAAVMRGRAEATGFSKEMVWESVRVEQESSRAGDMRAALANEFGDAGVLDGFVRRAQANARVRALGPELTFCLSPGNIPALSHLPFMRALLVKSPVLCKTAHAEPVYAAAYARTLARLEPALEDCMAVLYWPGGSVALEEAALNEADAVISFGTQATCDSIARPARPATRLVLHGHKLGFAVIGEGAPPPEPLAAALAYDVAMFDQQACLSPHWVFVEGDPAPLAGALVDALRRQQAALPKGTPPVEERVAFARAWDDAELAGAMGEPVRVHSRRGADNFLVVSGPPPLQPSCLGRAVRLVPFEGLEGLRACLAAFAGYFQNACVEAGPEATPRYAELLAELGVTRVCRAGQMATPTMMWHHDGYPCIEALVRYCDMDERPGPG